jgi:hypothetical protein
MSMIGNFQHATDEEIAQLLAQPDRIHAFLHGEGDYEDRADLDIEKAWHGIHFLLTGSDWGGEEPLNFLVSGGVKVGDEDVGYGPARAFTSARVREIDAALARISAQDLRARYDAQKLDREGIYPHIWDRPDEEQSNREDLAIRYEQVRQFVATLARDGLGMLVYLN